MLPIIISLIKVLELVNIGTTRYLSESPLAHLWYGFKSVFFSYSVRLFNIETQ